MNLASKKIIAICGVTLLTQIGPVFAGEDGTKPWKGEAELGIVKTSGNTSTQSITARGAITHERDQWRHNGKIEALNTSSSNATTAERYMVSGKSDYNLDTLNYVFGSITYENDRFAGFDYRTTEAVGYGRRVINAAALTLDVEVGPGGRQTKFSNGDSKNEVIGRVAGNLTWKVSENATFTEELSSDIGEDATITKSVTALKAQVANNLAMKASLTVRHISAVPIGVKKTDSETALTLVYGF